MATKVKKKTNKTVAVKFRTSVEQNRLIISRSNAFFNGNISEFLRHCIEGFRRPKS